MAESAEAKKLHDEIDYELADVFQPELQDANRIDDPAERLEALLYALNRVTKNLSAKLAKLGEESGN